MLTQKLINRGSRACLLVAIACCTHAGASVSWNAAADFSATSNPSGVWSYGTRSTSGGNSLLLLTDQQTLGPIASWGDNVNNSLGTPVVSKNTSNSTFQFGSVTWLGLDLTMHPGPVGFGAREFAVTRWTAPTDGPINISGGFLPADSGSTDVFVVLNGTAVFNAFRAGGSSVGFNLNAIVAVGDTVDFVVGNAGDFTFDTTVLNATIVPAPGMIGLAVSGIAAAGRRQRR